MSLLTLHYIYSYMNLCLNFIIGQKECFLFIKASHDPLVIFFPSQDTVQKITAQGLLKEGTGV